MSILSLSSPQSLFSEQSFCKAGRVNSPCLKPSSGPSSNPGRLWSSLTSLAPSLINSLLLLHTLAWQASTLVSSLAVCLALGHPCPVFFASSSRRCRGHLPQENFLVFLLSFLFLWFLYYGIYHALLELPAAAAKSLQSCLTLCYPIDGSPPGSPVPRVLQARTLEWVAISFSNAWKEKWKWSRSVVSDS